MWGAGSPASPGGQRPPEARPASRGRDAERLCRAWPRGGPAGARAVPQSRPLGAAASPSVSGRPVGPAGEETGPEASTGAHFLRGRRPKCSLSLKGMGGLRAQARSALPGVLRPQSSRFAVRDAPGVLGGLHDPWPALGGVDGHSVSAPGPRAPSVRSCAQCLGRCAAGLCTRPPRVVPSWRRIV